jgi:hypothetical protein
VEQQQLVLTHPEINHRIASRTSKKLQKSHSSQKVTEQQLVDSSQLNKSELVLIPRVTVHPDKLVLYKEAKWIGTRRSNNSQTTDSNEISEANLSFLHSARKNNGFLSNHAKRKLNKSLDYMIVTSDRKKVYSKVQKKYISYRIVFVTLTLPAKQIHSDKEITNKCWNQFIIELRKYHNVKRFVWRAEKQENGNIHYHILINQFVEWQELRKRWNRIVNKLGYVDRYQQAMTEFYKNGFRLSENPNDKRTVEQQRKAFIIGQKSNWTSPNSTDIHDTRKIKDIKSYVAKYMSKQPDVNLDDPDSIENVQQVNGRLWSSSHDLANPTGARLIEDWTISDELELIATTSKCRIYKADYFSVMYISFRDLAKFGTGLLFNYFSHYLNDVFSFSLQRSIV